MLILIFRTHTHFWYQDWTFVLWIETTTVPCFHEQTFWWGFFLKARFPHNNWSSTFNCLSSFWVGYFSTNWFFEQTTFLFLNFGTSFPIGFFYCSEPIILYSSISSSCSTEFKEPLSQSNTHVQEPLKHSDVHVQADPSSHTNLPSDHVINVLPNLVINAESWDIGCAFEVVSQAGGLATTTCIDMGSGINAISHQQLSHPGFEILNWWQADKLQVKVGNSTKVVINEEIHIMVKSERGFPRTLVLHYWWPSCSNTKQYHLGLRDGHLTWKGQKCIQANSAQLNITLPQVTNSDFYIDIERQDKTLVLSAETKAIPLRSSVFLPLTLNSHALSPEGFFFPLIGLESLLFLLGLVTIEQGKKHNTLNVLVMNHSETEV